MRTRVKFPYRRLERIFDELQAEALPQDELARRLSVSTRTVRNDIEILNSMLAKYNARFILRRNKGYRLEADDPARLYNAINTAHSPTGMLPRNAPERLDYLMVEFLTTRHVLNLQKLANRWYISRTTLQSDLVSVREQFHPYGLSIESRPRHGMQLMGSEAAIRLCLTDILRRLYRNNATYPLLYHDPALVDAPAIIQKKLRHCLKDTAFCLTDDGLEFLTFYCAVAAKRIAEGCHLQRVETTDMGLSIAAVTTAISQFLEEMAGAVLSPAERAFLQINIAGRAVANTLPDDINTDDATTLATYILDYINNHYHYDLRHDRQLHEDLTTHIKTMITRVRYRINLPNPTLSDIKQHYALAYDITLSAIASWAQYSRYTIPENEIGFLVLHIGVGIERHYQISQARQPQALLVCDSGNAGLRNLEAKIKRRFPEIEITETLRRQDYALLHTVHEDFVVANCKVETKNKPVVVIPAFPTEYQLTQLSKLVKIDRTSPFILDQYFSAEHFLIADEKMTRESLFTLMCNQLSQKGYVDQNFIASVIEREKILSTLLGDGIAIPHALGLFARKTTIFTTLAPHGILWGDNTAARIVFLIAASRADYEKIPSIFDLFISFIRKRATSSLASCRDFSSFKQTALRILRQDEPA